LTMKSLRRGIEFFFLRLIVSFFASLEEHSALRYGRALGLIVYGFLGNRRLVAHRNMKLCGIGLNATGREKILRKCLENFGITAAEFSRQKNYKNSDYQTKVVMNYPEYIDDALAQGRGLLLLSGHYCNWELLIQAIAARGHKSSLVVRQQHNLKVDEYVNRLRKNSSVDVILAEVQPRNVIKAFKQGRAVATLLDIWGGKDGMKAEFFGHGVSSMAGVMEIAARQRIPIMIGFLNRYKNGRQFLDIRRHLMPGENKKNSTAKELIDVYNKRLEEAIISKPFFWLWTHKRFKDVAEY
jgi:KDO2-lipid IV(A) lauroyltransferase